VVPIRKVLSLLAILPASVNALESISEEQIAISDGELVPKHRPQNFSTAESKKRRNS
jgi:hypothetical protein